MKFTNDKREIIQKTEIAKVIAVTVVVMLLVDTATLIKYYY